LHHSKVTSASQLPAEPGTGSFCPASDLSTRNPEHKSGTTSAVQTETKTQPRDLKGPGVSEVGVSRSEVSRVRGMPRQAGLRDRGHTQG
jgi:hypothetical protein